METRLYRSRDNKLVGGVCGGIAEYLRIDPTLTRIITVLLFLLPGLGILTYLVAWLIIPLRPLDAETPRADYSLSPWNKYLPGLILVALGVILLAKEYYFWFDWGDMWPVLVIIGGVALIVFGFRGRRDHETPGSQSRQANGESGGTVS